MRVGACLEQLRACFFGACLVYFLVDYEKGLAFVDVGAFLKKHLFEVAFHACAYLYELLGAYAAGIFAVYVDVGGADRLDGHYGRSGNFCLGFEKEPQPYACCCKYDK